MSLEMFEQAARQANQQVDRSLKLLEIMSKQRDEARRQRDEARIEMRKLANERRMMAENMSAMREKNEKLTHRISTLLAQLAEQDQKL